MINEHSDNANQLDRSEESGFIAVNTDCDDFYDCDLSEEEIKEIEDFNASIDKTGEALISFYGGASEAAGCSSRMYNLSVLPSPTLTAICEHIVSPTVTPSCSDPDGFAKILSISTFLVNEIPAGDLNAAVELGAACRIDVLPPFAGG